MNRGIVLLVAVLSSFTVLHKGRIDSNGGHYDRSSGEYHYHHGYSAHNHYDMNGDGVVDCPYDFKDNTSNKNNTSDKNSTSKSESKTNNAPESTNNSVKKQKSTTTFKDVLGIIFIVAIFFLLVYSAMMVLVIWVIGVIGVIAKAAKKRSNKNLDFLTSDKSYEITWGVVFIISVVITLIIMLHAKGII